MRPLPPLLLLCLALPAQRPSDKEIQACLDRARPHLLEATRLQRQGRLALLCLALLHDKVDPASPPFARAIRKLAAENLQQCYDLSLRLMVMAHCPGYPDRQAAAERDCKELLRRRRGDGGFTYTRNGGRTDLSNTQYAALGLRAAASMQVSVPREIWLRLRRYVLAGEVYRGGFGYTGKARRPTASMTVAGIAVLQICAARLQDQGSKSHKRAAGALERAWKWMARHDKEIGAGAPAMRNYYFHYGLERAAILCDKQTVGSLDWYRRGARMLLEHEAPTGAWSMIRAKAPPRRRRGRPVLRVATPMDPILSSFAVLFLRRAFQKHLGPPITPSGLRASNLPIEASEAQIGIATRYEIARGLRAVPDLLRALRSPSLARRKVGAAALPRITGRFFRLSPYRSPADNAELLRAIEGWWLKEGRRQLPDAGR